jgi:hypothetical protein
MQTIHIQKDFSCPVTTLYAFLSDHNNLSQVFAPAKVTRIKDGDTELNGKGSIRRLSIPGVPAFEETVTEAQQNELIRYRISRGSPLRNHEGVMRFSSRDNEKSHLDYIITFDSAIPGLAWLVKLLLARAINKGLNGYQQRLANA